MSDEILADAAPKSELKMIYFVIIPKVKWGFANTVVKRGHTEGIEREKTHGIALPSIFEFFQIWGQNTIGGQYLQNINTLKFWYKYLQKVNTMPSDFWWKKQTSFAPLMNIF